jgi:ATP-binding cassette subfamily B multidrug efflux pump
LTLGSDVSDEEIWAACETVQVADFIRGLEHGLDTRLRERGGNLSAGQRQLMAFARVLLHDPPVLILDEATSSIDSETEQKLQHAVNAVTGGRTSLVVAHRISTIQHADRIIVMSHGRIVEEGNHTALLDRRGLYATLYQLQYVQRGSSPN